MENDFEALLRRAQESGLPACEYCDAEVGVEKVSDAGSGIFHITTYHDDDCPFLADYQARGLAARS